MSKHELKNKVRKASAQFRSAMEHATPEARKTYLKEHPKADPADHTVSQGGGEKSSKSPELASKNDLAVIKRKRKSIDTATSNVQQAVRETGEANYDKPAKIQKAVRKVAPHVEHLLKEAKRVGEALEQASKNPPSRDKAFWKKYRSSAAKWEKHLKETVDTLNSDIKKWPDPKVVKTLQSLSSDAKTFSFFLADLPK